MRIAAVQFEGVPGDVSENLRRLKPLVAEAVDAGAEAIALPEFFTSPVVFRPEVHDAVLAPDNAAVAMLRDVARRHGVLIGGSMLLADDVEVGARPPRQPIARRFWMPDLPWAIRAYWWQQNAFARRYYRDRGRAAGLHAASRAGASS